MQLLPSTHMQPAWLDKSGAPLCLRPGERPVWVNVSACEAAWPAWRTAAASARLPLDVVLSLLLEWRLTLEVLKDADSAFTERVPHEPAPDRLPPPDLRGWVSQLEHGACIEDVEDELPEVTIPQRLWHRLTPTADLSALDLDDLPAARAADVRAARHGLTLESWVLATQLRLDAQARR